MNTTVSKYKLGFIMLRIERVGRAGKLLKKTGGFYFEEMQMNNRNAFSWAIPCKTYRDFASFDFKPLEQKGLRGMAFWFSDAQWQSNAALTTKQWQERRIIG